LLACAELKARRARNPVGREGGTTYSGAEVYGDDGQGGMELIPDTGFSHSQLRQVAIIEDEVNQRFAIVSPSRAFKIVGLDWIYFL